MLPVHPIDQYTLLERLHLNDCESKQSIIRALQVQSRPRSSFYTRAQKSVMSSVQSYIDQHSLQKNVEDVLTACVKATPEEPLTFMVRDARG